MASVALRGFEQFEAALARAWNGGRPDPFGALDRLGKAYLEFARAQPAFYSAMFEGGAPVAGNSSLREAGEKAFAILRAAADEVCAAMPAAGRPPALMVALHIWAMAHGVASLFGRGDGAHRAMPMSPAELLEADMLIYLRGLVALRRAPEGPAIGHTFNRVRIYPAHHRPPGITPTPLSSHSRDRRPPRRDLTTAANRSKCSLHLQARTPCQFF